MPYERKSYGGQASVTDAEQGIVHAVVSVFGTVDGDGDVMEAGAFAKAIEAGKSRSRLPPGVLAHDWKTPVARTDDAWEDEQGLHVIGRFNLETSAGRDTFSNIKHGLFTEYSFGFKTLDHELKAGHRHIKAVDWFEWSPVLVGANRDTHTVAVKQATADQTVFSLPVGLTFTESLELALAAVGQATTRGVEIQALRVKEGRMLSTANRTRLATCRDALKQTHDDLHALLAEMDTQDAAREAATLAPKSATPDQVRDALSHLALIEARLYGVA